MHKITMQACILLIFIFCAGCSTFSPPQTVNVPVIVPCIKDVPISPDDAFADSKGKSAFDQIKALLIDRESSRGYEAELNAVIDGCR